MRYRYTFDVKSHAQLVVTFSFTHKDFTFSLVETDGRFTQLIIDTGSVGVLLPAPLKPTPGETPTIRIPFDPFLNDAIEEMRTIRGALVLWGVYDINVDELLREFLPDTPEEAAAFPCLSMRYLGPTRDHLPIIPQAPDLLARCVLSREKLGLYELPLEFYRRGADDRFHRQYVEAIFNFYFVLEYLFADGQFRTTKVVENFLASSQLRASLAEARSQFTSAIQSEEWLQQFHEKYGIPPDAEVMKTIVDLRGRLHHQSIRRTNWHPGLQKEFAADAHFLGAVCQSVLSRIVLDVLYEEPEKKEFLATNFFDVNGNQMKLINPEQLDA